MLWLHAVKTLKQSQYITQLAGFTLELHIWVFFSFFPGMCIHAFSHLSRAAKITCYFLNLFTSFKYNWRPQLSWLSTFLFGLNGFAPSTNYNSPRALQDSLCEYLWETSFPPLWFLQESTRQLWYWMLKLHGFSPTSRWHEVQFFIFCVSVIAPCCSVIELNNCKSGQWCTVASQLVLSELT